MKIHKWYCDNCGAEIDELLDTKDYYDSFFGKAVFSIKLYMPDLCLKCMKALLRTFFTDTNLRVKIEAGLVGRNPLA